MNKTTTQPVKNEHYETPEVQDIAPVSVAVKGNDTGGNNEDVGL